MSFFYFASLNACWFLQKHLDYSLSISMERLLVRRPNLYGRGNVTSNLRKWSINIISVYFSKDPGNGIFVLQKIPMLESLPILLIVFSYDMTVCLEVFSYHKNAQLSKSKRSNSFRLEKFLFEILVQFRVQAGSLIGLLQVFAFSQQRCKYVEKCILSGLRDVDQATLNVTELFVVLCLFQIARLEEENRGLRSKQLPVQREAEVRISRDLSRDFEQKIKRLEVELEAADEQRRNATEEIVQLRSQLSESEHASRGHKEALVREVGGIGAQRSPSAQGGWGRGTEKS